LLAYAATPAGQLYIKLKNLTYVICVNFPKNCVMLFACTKTNFVT